MVNSFISKPPKSSKDIVKVLAICLIILHRKIKVNFSKHIPFIPWTLNTTYNRPGSGNWIIKQDEINIYPNILIFFLCLKF